MNNRRTITAKTARTDRRVRCARQRRRVLISLLLMLLLIGLVPTVHAQDDGDSDDEGDEAGIIYGSNAEMLFPSAIRFFVGVNVLGDDLRAARLTVRQVSGLQQSFDVDPAAHLYDERGQSAQVAFVWDLGTAASPPVPFEPLNFLWEVETVDGRVDESLGELLVVDAQRDEWETAGEPPLILHWYSENLAGRAIREEVMAAYGEMSRNTGLSPIVQYAIYDPGARFCREVVVDEDEDGEPLDEPYTVLAVVSERDGALFPCSPDAVTDLYHAAGIRFLQRESFGYVALQNALILDLVQVAYADLWGSVDVPAWFGYGLASLHRLYADTAALPTVRAAARTDSLLSQRALADPLPPGTSFQQQTLWDAQSYLLALFLADEYGAIAPFELAREIAGAGTSFAAVLRDFTGQDERALFDAWERWLFTDAAERATNWTPYDTTTPTPTVTATATPVPPTPTPSATPTDTPTATSTFLGDLPPTPVELPRTSTRARTPTNTPLPPGSLPTRAAPAVAAGDSGETDESGTDMTLLLGVGVGVLVALAAVFGLVVAARRRR